MKAQNKSMALFGIAFGLLLALSVQAAPLVSNVVGVQRAGTKLVDITYDLTDAEYSSFIVTIKISKDAGATWDVPCESVSGDGIGSGVDPGKNKSIVWDAGADWNGQWSDRMKVKITATVDGIGGEGDDDPLGGEYLVVDLSMGPNAARYPMSRLDAVPANGWTDEYKTTKLVLRKIPAGTLVMGSPENERGRDADVETQHHVTLTKGFYVGVFEVTQKQWELVVGSWPSKFSNETCRDTRPVERVSHDKIRGKTHGMFWPGSYAVDADSFMGRLRAKTGLEFDLPTEAQWEYACRAGTTTALNSGKNLTDVNGCQNVAELGRYWFNGGRNQADGVDTTGGTAKVGSYLPNAWGLYDMHGNVFEWCLDWWNGADYDFPPDEETETDPVGEPDGEYHVIRGGSWSNFAADCRSANRGAYVAAAAGPDVGFRLALGAVATNPTAPSANNDAYLIPVNTQLVVPTPGVLANDTDPENDPLTAIIVSGPYYGILALNAHGSFTYKPFQGFEGVDAFAYRANDGFNDSSLATVTITVGEPGSGDEYLVVDLSAGPNAVSYPVSYLDKARDGAWPPTWYWPDGYWTTRLLLRKIPAGTFMMGSPGEPDAEFGRNPEGGEKETLHQVTLTKDFYVGVFEVTQRQWELVMGARPSKFYNEACYAARPVENVSYEDIRGSDLGSGWPANNAVDGYSFMGRLRAKTGLDFDLPTEAQWEYACRAGTLTALNSGMNLTTEEDCANLGEVGRYWFNGGQDQEAGVDTDGGTARAGSYQPNTWGLYDMHGNVLEWCLDWWDGGDYSPQPATDPKGGNGNPLPDNSPCRIIRGGSWAYFANCCRSAYRGYGPPTARVDTVGFRVVKTMR